MLALIDNYDSFTEATLAPADTLPVLSSVDDYLRFCMEYDASDLHLATGAQPAWRRYGNLQPIWNNAALLTPEDARRLAYGFLGEAQIKQLEARGDVDFAWTRLRAARGGRSDQLPD